MQRLVTYSHTKKPPKAIGHRVKYQPNVLRWAQIVKVRKEARVKLDGYSSRMGSALVCVRRNAKHGDLNLPESTRFVLIIVIMVDVSPNRSTGCLVSPPPLSSQNI